MLSGEITSLDDIPQNDMRRRYPRFQPDTFPINLKLVEQVQQLAKKRDLTPAQLAINWTRALSKRPGMPLIIPIPGATTVARVKENSKVVDLSEQDLKEIDETLAQFEVKGTRYPAGHPIEG
jgi:pyridoxine 4-dehydrogenase